MTRGLRWALAGGLVASVVTVSAFVARPLPAGLLEYRPVSSVRILDRDGELLRELKSRADGRSTPLKAEAFSPEVVASFLASEDAGFFHHAGLSPTAIIRAALINLRAEKVVSGGSTITQQLARTLVPRPRTFIGKAQEALWALRLEAHLSKGEILTQYLNRVPFGNNTFGLAAAAEVYFGASPEHLSLGQAAMLASIPRGPTAYNPFRAGPRLEARRQWVHSQLEKHALFDVERVRASKAEPVDVSAFVSAFHAPHFVDFVSAHLEAWGLGDAVTVQTSLDSGLGLALGNGEVSLWETARAYAGLSHGGVVKPLRPVLHAWSADGTEIDLAEPAPKPRRFAGSQAVALVTHILSDNAARARAFGLDNALRFPFPVAAKTGTSKGYSDNWTVGFTAERTVAVWAGNFDGTPMVQVSGITGAGPVFKRVMNRAMNGLSPRALVNERGLQRERICPLSGHLAGPFCPAAMSELFLDGTAPVEPCEMHGTLTADLPLDVQRQCLQVAHAEGRLVDLGLDFYDWAHNEGLSQQPWLASVCLGSEHSMNGTRILHPMNGDEFLVISDLPLADQAISLRVRAAPSLGVLDVRIDGTPALSLAPPYTGRVPVTKGSHLLDVRTSSGQSLAQVRYVVRGE